jgi:hypothetical protein
MIADTAHPLYGASLKLDRAGDQFKALRAEMESFLKSDVYEKQIQLYTDTDPQLVVHAWRLKQPYPAMWSAMIGEIIHNLRSALDHLVFQLIILETGGPPTSNKTQFPIFLAEDGFKNRGIPQMIPKVGAKATALIKSVQPFATKEGKQSPLWHLSELSNWDKHRSIHVAGLATTKISSQLEYSVDGSGPIVFPPGLLKADFTPLYGAIIPKGPESIDVRAGKVNVNGEATVDIAFDQPASQRGLLVRELLGTFGNRVFGIAERIDNEIFSAK